MIGVYVCVNVTGTVHLRAMNQQCEMLSVYYINIHNTYERTYIYLMLTLHLMTMI